MLGFQILSHTQVKFVCLQNGWCVHKIGHFLCMWYLRRRYFLGMSGKWEPSSLSESHNGWFALNSWRDPFDVQPMQPLDRPLQSTGMWGKKSKGKGWKNGCSLSVELWSFQASVDWVDFLVLWLQTLKQLRYIASLNKPHMIGKGPNFWSASTPFTPQHLTILDHCSALNWWLMLKNGDIWTGWKGFLWVGYGNHCQPEGYDGGFWAHIRAFSTRRAGRSSRVFLGVHDQISCELQSFCFVGV